MEDMSESLVVWVGYFLLMVLRISAIFTISPVFGRKNTPGIAKIALSVLMAYISISVFPPNSNQFYNNIFEYVIVCIKELTIGLIIGLITTVFFSTVLTAGHIIDIQIGFSASQVFDPQSSSSIPIMGNILQMIMLVCFFAGDGHHLLIRLISDTFRIIPVGSAAIKPQMAITFTQIFVTTFAISIKIAMPIIAASFLTEVILGILMRVVPQLNFFVIGFPIKIGLGLIILILFIPIFVSASNSIFESMMDAIKKTFEGMVA